jgi:replicative DNA helicase
MREHEEKLLGCILIEPETIDKCNLTEEHFLHPNTRRVFRAMKKCQELQAKIDYISIRDMDNEIDAAYAVTLHDRTPSAANWTYYNTEVIKAFQRYRILQLGRKLSAVDKQTEPMELIDSAEKELFELSTNLRSNTIQKIGQVLPGAMVKLEERYNLKGKLPGISTGLPFVDFHTGGLQDSRYMIIGARPSDGKSALALNMALHISVKEKLPVGFISAESSANEIVLRSISSIGRIDGEKLNAGTIAGADFTSILDANELLNPAPLYIYDAPNCGFSEAKSVARQMVMMGCKVLFFDYIQIIGWENIRIQKHEQVGEVSKGLKQLARELHVPVVALAQLRRDSEGREPTMADLSDASQLEKDADTLLFIYHPKVAEGEEAKPSKLIISKNRDGAKGAVDVVFKREYVTFYELDRDSR